MSENQKNSPLSRPEEAEEVGENALADDIFEIDGDAMPFDTETLVEEIISAPEEAEAAATPATGEISREAVFELMQELRQRNEQVARLNDEKNELYDKLLRKQAEFENFRKRSERESQDAYGRARADVIAEFLSVLDNVTLALQHAEGSDPDSILEGLGLINKQLVETLNRLGLEPIDAEGQPFDPELHEAVATEARHDVPDHTVVDAFQRGYKVGDRLLRPARVKVAVQPENG
jgi:molecular chaperone GrpE